MCEARGPGPRAFRAVEMCRFCGSLDLAGRGLDRLLLLYSYKVFREDNHRVPLLAREEIQIDQHHVDINKSHDTHYRSVKARTSYDSAPRYQFAQSRQTVHPQTLPDSYWSPLV